MSSLSPSHAYIVAATPRSGSTLLCESLKATGVAGRPAEHFEALATTGHPHQPRDYFIGAEPELLEGLPPLDPGVAIEAAAARARLERALEAGTTPNGVFATKIMWGYKADFEAGVGLLTEVFPDAAYVQIVREDKVGQAVSLWRAIQTQAWRDEAPEHLTAGAAEAADHAEYAFGPIDHLLGLLTEHEAAWTAWFEDHDIRAHRIVYEALAADVPGTIGGLLEDLGIELDDGHELPQPKMRRQADERSAEWARRYAADRVAAVGT